MARLPIRWVEARTHAHATEDEARVLQALDLACDGDPPRREAFEGHFRNPIVRLTRHVRDARAIDATWRRWMAAGLPDELLRDVDRRVDEDGVLHFRLDKQEAYAGRLSLARTADSIDVRVRLGAYPATLDSFVRVARSLLEGR